MQTSHLFWLNNNQCFKLIIPNKSWSRTKCVKSRISLQFEPIQYKESHPFEHIYCIPVQPSVCTHGHVLRKWLYSNKHVTPQSHCVDMYLEVEILLHISGPKWEYPLTRAVFYSWGLHKYIYRKITIVSIYSRNSTNTFFWWWSGYRQYKNAVEYCHAIVWH